MPKITILFSESAISDLEELKRWYCEQGVPGTGNRFVTEILERIESLRDHPDMGRVVPEFEQLFLREITHPPFRIVYRHEPKKVRVVRVWRSERRLRLPTDRDES